LTSLVLRQILFLDSLNRIALFGAHLYCEHAKILFSLSDFRLHFHDCTFQGKHWIDAVVQSNTKKIEMEAVNILSVGPEVMRRLLACSKQVGDGLFSSVTQSQMTLGVPELEALAIVSEENLVNYYVAGFLLSLEVSIAYTQELAAWTR